MTVPNDPQPQLHNLTDTNGVLTTTQVPAVTFVLTAAPNNAAASYEQFWIAEGLDAFVGAAQGNTTLGMVLNLLASTRNR